VPSVLARKRRVSDTDPGPEANGSSQAEQLKGEIAMHTLFDDIAATVITAAFAIVCASSMVVMLATSVATTI